jgi:hypothetical protein
MGHVGRRSPAHVTHFDENLFDFLGYRASRHAWVSIDYLTSKL